MVVTRALPGRVELGNEKERCISEGKETKSSSVPLHFKVTTDVKYVLCISKGHKKNFIFFTVTNGGNDLNFFYHKERIYV